MSLEEEVLEEIRPRPGEEESLLKTYRHVKSVAEGYLEEKGLEAEVTLQGSVAKGTWLSGDVDLDVFILFPKKLGKTWIKGKALGVLAGIAERGGWRYQARYAEHPYITMLVDHVSVDLVPALRLDNPLEAETAVDRTPFHTRYVANRMGGRERDQARLLKKFMKGIGVYGAEVKVQGFSGYLAELLIIKYGSFRKVLENASGWRRQVRIMVEDGEEPLWELWDTPMAVPDPVDPRRNAAASVSHRKLGEFTLASKLYLARPSRLFFHGAEKQGPVGDTVTVVVEGVPALPPDILWGELGRVARRIRGVLKNRGFRVADVLIWSDEQGRAAWCIELESPILSKHELIIGPAFDDHRAAEGFIKAYLSRGIPFWVDWEGRLRALRLRKHRSAAEVLERFYSEYLTAPHLKGLRPLVKPGVGAPCLKKSFLAGYVARERRTA